MVYSVRHIIVIQSFAVTVCENRLITFFFFQAEDGIRDLIVTGVQTCALPISFSPSFILHPSAFILIFIPCASACPSASPSARRDRRRRGRAGSSRLPSASAPSTRARTRRAERPPSTVRPRLAR